MDSRLESLEILSNSGIVMSDETISTKFCHLCFIVKNKKQITKNNKHPYIIPNERITLFWDLCISFMMCKNLSFHHSSQRDNTE